MAGDVYWYTYRRIRVYLPVHLAAIASIDSYSNSCGVDCTDRCVLSLGLLGLGPQAQTWQHNLSDALRAAPKPALRDGVSPLA